VRRHRLTVGRQAPQGSELRRWVASRRARRGGGGCRGQLTAVPAGHCCGGRRPTTGRRPLDKGAGDRRPTAHRRPRDKGAKDRWACSRRAGDRRAATTNRQAGHHWAGDRLTTTSWQALRRGARDTSRAADNPTIHRGGGVHPWTSESRHVFSWRQRPVAVITAVSLGAASAEEAQAHAVEGRSVRRVCGGA